ncbi:ImmA/IrrE family metallo-endopeptidase [Limosilactobacillus sp.]|nr:ImmA/IrrE family metallo-endopeptidase [Limosilactobacillus sp.]MDY4865764.1 ImmA/IrrE family metallo-endopeptidase [Limosilactobacillus sp.]
MICEQAEEACNYLLEKAQEYHIDVKWKHFSPITPPGSSYEYRRVVMNLDWHNPKEFIFQLAHEISHVIHGDKGDIYYYHACFTGRESVEYKANLGAVKLLVPYYCQHRNRENINAYEFETLFNVPTYLNDVVIKELRNYF